ncbi:MAG: ammonium transporter [SAR324 cluster bacterium]|nr:ammonium transporter [SAR324 cluster bacterium]
MDQTLIDILWVALCASLVFLMQAGFLCLETGLTRSKNNINVAIKNISDLGIAVFVFWMIGYTLMFGTSTLGVIGMIAEEPAKGGMKLLIFFLFQSMFCSTAVTIISGAVAERMRFVIYLLLSLFISVCIYPVFGHWAWNGSIESVSSGWLRSRGFVDFAGSTVVHSVGGWAALAAIIVIGQRTGRFTPEGEPKKIPASNVPLAILGTLLLWFGWFGFNGGGTLAMNDQVPLIIVNTLLAGTGGIVTALGLGWLVVKYIDVELIINGCLSGLVAVTASAPFVTPGWAIVIGALGSIVMLGCQQLLLHYQIDDAIGVVPVHAGAGIWGTLSVAFFGDSALLGTGLNSWEQLKIQILGIAVCFIWSFGGTYYFLKLIKLFVPLRVTPEEEHIGLNVAEHRAKTELLDVLQAMEYQAKSQDFTKRLPVEPFTTVGVIAERYNQVISSLQKAEKTLVSKNTEMEEDLDLAKQFQQSLLPYFPEVSFLSFDYRYLPFHNGVSGDMYDISLNPDGAINIFLGDATGHGISAAFMTMIVQSKLDSMPESMSTSEVLGEINALLASKNIGNKFITGVFLRITPEGNMSLSHAAHPPAIIVPADETDAILFKKQGGLPLGAFEDDLIPYMESTYQLQKGDKIFLYTDGITEWSNPQKRMFGIERLKRVLEKNRHTDLGFALTDVFASLKDYSQGTGCHDDATILGFEFQG